jgi:dephospho-CoA kinase
VKRVLVMGMSATGKSGVVAELVARGYRAADTDDGICEVRRRAAPGETVTTQPLDEVVTTLLRLVDS